MSNQVFCSWVNARVDKDDLHPICFDHIVSTNILNGEVDMSCYHCELSPMIANGMPIKDMLRNLRGE
jgi:hypothetical protein